MERNAKSVKSINRPYNLEVQSTYMHDFCIGAEPTERNLRKQGGKEPNRALVVATVAAPV